MELEVYYCEECGKPFTEDDEEEAGIFDPNHWLCPDCYLEKIKEESESMIKCFLCGKRIKERIIPLTQAWLDKWDDDWGIERIYNGKIVIVCLECYRKLSNFGES